MDALPLLLFCLGLTAALPQGTPVFRAGSGKGRPVLREGTAKEEALPRVMEFLATGDAVCPIPDGTFEDPDFCDRYWICSAGNPTEHSCEDGLVFDYQNKVSEDPCNTPYVVSCGKDRVMQEPTYPSEFCPRRHGTFKHPDPTVCDIYYSCTHGNHVEYSCESGLHFDQKRGKCNWAAEAQRQGCVDQPKVAEGSDFTCLPGPHFDSLGQPNPHPAFANKEDCTKFWVCLNGKIPQPASCNVKYNEVFNELTGLCDSPENVPECNHTGTPARR